jgi:hypothetical protein
MGVPAGERWGVGRAVGLAAVVAAITLLSSDASAQAGKARPGVAPTDAWTCPTAQPIKGNFTTSSGERCIYHVPGGQFYSRTKPERCYATDDEARQDGCRKSKR